MPLLGLQVKSPICSFSCGIHTQIGREAWAAVSRPTANKLRLNSMHQELMHNA